MTTIDEYVKIAKRKADGIIFHGNAGKRLDHSVNVGDKVTLYVEDMPENRNTIKVKITEINNDDFVGEMVQNALRKDKLQIILLE
ncbi:MAG: hypothetical protein C4522_16315 [Desulfobacteraceae bacterium]|nr:MAG: hypothetical protein C4522_16315 [Desulfobacteraceae bacterium]